MPERKAIPLAVKIEVLTEAGYRCAVPTCRGILALDLHHLNQVSDGGGEEPSNLIALCPTCHALHHRGTIEKRSLLVWKTVLTSLTHAFDTESVDNLLFLEKTETQPVRISGDGVLKFNRLIAADLAMFNMFAQNGPLCLYIIRLTEKGKSFLEVWRQGERSPFLGLQNLNQAARFNALEFDLLTTFQPQSDCWGVQKGVAKARYVSGVLTSP